MTVPVARTIFILMVMGGGVLAAPPVDDPTPQAATADSIPPPPALAPLPGPETPAAPRDSLVPFVPQPVLTSIELTPEGVVGDDTLGDWWEYDFTVERFVRGSRSYREDSRREIARPVEERSVTRLEVQPYQTTVTVGYDKYVEGNITATGRVVVKGWVRGDIQSFSQVLVEPTGQVDGSIRAPDIIVKPGGIVLGEQEISPLSTDYLTWSYAIDGVLIVTGLFVLLLFVAFIYTVLAPLQLAHIDRCIRDYRSKSFVMGFLLLLLLVPVLGVLAITIVGLILVLLIPLAYVVAMAIGLILFGNDLARKTVSRLAPGRCGGFLLCFVGSFLVCLLWLAVALLMGSPNSVAHGFGIAALVLAILTTFYPACCGLGAAFLTRFGFRSYVSFRDRQTTGEPGAPAPPPIPKVPPSITPPGRRPVPPRGHSPFSSGNE